MAIDQLPVTPEPVLVQSTAIDPLRKYAAYGLGAIAGASILLGIVASVFPSLGANAAPALQYGTQLLLLATGVVWDRQAPVIK